MKLGGAFLVYVNGEFRCRSRNTLVVEGFVEMWQRLFTLDTNAAYEPFYMGLIDATGFSAIDVGDTMGSHGWTELEDYDEPTRPALTFASADYVPVGHARLSSNQAGFGPSGSVSVQGFFVVLGDDVKGATDGILFCASELDTPPLDLTSADSLSIAYVMEEVDTSP